MIIIIKQHKPIP